MACASRRPLRSASEEARHLGHGATAVHAGSCARGGAGHLQRRLADSGDQAASAALCRLATRLITGGDRAGAPRVVMLTTFDLDDYVYEALRAGASGFLLKDAPRHDLIAAIKIAAAGNALLAPSVTMRLIDAFARRPAQTLPTPSKLASLTVRERDILLRLARGLTNAEIAADLVVSEATVKSHVGNLLAKLGLRDRVQAVILAYESGIVRPGDPDAGPGRPHELPRDRGVGR